MNIGSLYQVKKYFWLLFPTKEIISNSEAVGVGAGAVGEAKVLRGVDATEREAGNVAAWYSRKYNCNVTYFSHDTFVVCLEEDGKFKKVLTSEGLIGWTWFGERYNECFEEVKP
jgi:uncharacterized UPF0160 family protein